MNNRELLSQGFTCVITRNGEMIFASKDRGIKPLLTVISENIDTKNCTAVDKIVGKAAALLYVYMGVSEVYAEVMGKDGLYILQKHDIKAVYQTLTDHITNRVGNDICPMEKTVSEISEPESALAALKEKAAQIININKSNNLH